MDIINSDDDEDVTMVHAAESETVVEELCRSVDVMDVD